MGSQAEKELDKVKADLAFAQLQIEDLEEKLHRASSKLAAKDPAAVPAGAEGALRLVESCTFLISEDKKSIATALPGDLVKVTSVEDAKKIQAKLGPGHRVYAVTKKTLDDLSACGFVAT